MRWLEIEGALSGGQGGLVPDDAVQIAPWGDVPPVVVARRRLLSLAQLERATPELQKRRAKGMTVGIFGAKYWRREDRERHG